jgi:hypothetical protein
MVQICASPTLPAGKESPMSIEYEAEWAPEEDRALWNRETCVAPARN